MSDQLVSRWIDNVFSLIETLFQSSNGEIEPMMMYLCDENPIKILPMDFRQSLNKVVSFRKAQIVSDMIGATCSVLVAQAFKTDENSRTEEVLYLLAEVGSIKMAGQAHIVIDLDGNKKLSELELGTPKRIVGFTDFILEINRAWPKSKFTSFAPRLSTKSISVGKEGTHLLKLPASYQEDFWAPEIYSNGTPIVIRYGYKEDVRYLSGYYAATDNNLEEDLNRFGLAALDAMATGFFPVVGNLLWALPPAYLEDRDLAMGLAEKFFVKYALDISIIFGESLGVKTDDGHDTTVEQERVVH